MYINHHIAPAVQTVERQVAQKQRSRFFRWFGGLFGLKSLVLGLDKARQAGVNPFYAGYAQRLQSKGRFVRWLFGLNKLQKACQKASDEIDAHREAAQAQRASESINERSAFGFQTKPVVNQDPHLGGRAFRLALARVSGNKIAVAAEAKQTAQNYQTNLDRWAPEKNSAAEQVVAIESTIQRLKKRADNEAALIDRRSEERESLRKDVFRMVGEGCSDRMAEFHYRLLDERDAVCETAANSREHCYRSIRERQEALNWTNAPIEVVADAKGMPHMIVSQERFGRQDRVIINPETGSPKAGRTTQGREGYQHLQAGQLVVEAPASYEVKAHIFKPKAR